MDTQPSDRGIYKWDDVSETLVYVKAIEKPKPPHEPPPVLHTGVYL